MLTWLQATRLLACKIRQELSLRSENYGHHLPALYLGDRGEITVYEVHQSTTAVGKVFLYTQMSNVVIGLICMGIALFTILLITLNLLAFAIRPYQEKQPHSRQKWLDSMKTLLSEF